jgi:hypothetical protein
MASIPSGSLSAASAALRAGFSASAAAVAVAIAGAESTWRLDAKGDTCGGLAGPCASSCQGYCSFGPWQVNVCAHARLMRSLTSSSDPCVWSQWLADWDHAARAAYEVSSHGTDWTPWTTYNTGAYRSYLSVAQQAVQQASAGAVEHLPPVQGPSLPLPPRTVLYLGMALVAAGGGALALALDPELRQDALVAARDLERWLVGEAELVESELGQLP